MAASDVPDEAVEAALYGKLRPIVDAHLDHFEAITRADERAQVLAKVDATLRDRERYERWVAETQRHSRSRGTHADYLAETLGYEGTVRLNETGS